MADSVTRKAYAKLNLSLNITGTLPDGMHTVDMVMQSIDLYDTVTVERTDNGIDISCHGADLPEDMNNIAAKAAEEFFKYAQIDGGVYIKIKKRIPCAAGLGGGSTDAAAVLCTMNELFGTNYDEDVLCTIAERIGSDVPFCISGGTQRAEGTGTILSPLPELTDCAFVVIKEGEKLSTGDMYKKYDSFPDKCTPDTETLIEAICEGNVEEAAKAMANVFEPLWGETAAEIKSELLECGAINAVLSGSGPSIFGVFADESNANAARSKISDKYENIYVCTPVSVKNIDE